MINVDELFTKINLHKIQAQMKNIQKRFWKTFQELISDKKCFVDIENELEQFVGWRRKVLAQSRLSKGLDETDECKLGYNGNDDDDEKQFNIISSSFLIASFRYLDKVSSIKQEITKILHNRNKPLYRDKKTILYCTISKANLVSQRRICRLHEIRS